MDRVTKKYLEAFREEQSLTGTEPDNFEHFVNYCVVSDAYDDEFNITDIHMGGGNDLAIDGVAIIVNGVLVTSEEEVSDLVEINNSIDATFILTQAKSSPRFDGAEIGAFLDGVNEFFAESTAYPVNEAIANARAVMQSIYESSLKFRRGKPGCRLVFASTGKWTGDQFLTARTERGVEVLRSTGLFSNVTFLPMDADEIQNSYQRSKNSIRTEFAFPSKVLLPDIAGVTEAYLGSLPATEFLKLITDGFGNIRKSLFTDNVRDFQGTNSVNREIDTTLNDDAAKGRFVVLNNGVTIVARELTTTRDKVAMVDYQIVNGCQTSHVLFDNRDRLTDDVQVPIKVIATRDEDVINSIVTATNRQTQVTSEDLFALGSYQKKLESFLGAYGDRKKLFYERRSKQYNSTAGVEKVRIVTKVQLIKAFASMFLDDAHRANSYYGDLYSQVGTRIFNEQHKLEPYYTAAYAQYKLEFLFRNGAIPAYYKPARFHLLMALRVIAGGADMPNLGANKMQSYCTSICEELWDNAKAVEVFKSCIDAIEVAAGANNLSRALAKTRSFTEAVKDALTKRSTA